MLMLHLSLQSIQNRNIIGQQKQTRSFINFNTISNNKSRSQSEGVIDKMIKSGENNLLPLSILVGPNSRAPTFIQHSNIHKLQQDSRQEEKEKLVQNKSRKVEKKENQSCQTKTYQQKTANQSTRNKLTNDVTKIKPNNANAQKPTQRADFPSKSNNFSNYLYKNTEKPKPKVNYSARAAKPDSFKPYPVANYKTKSNQNKASKINKEVPASTQSIQQNADKLNINVSIINCLEQPTQSHEGIVLDGIEHITQEASKLIRKYKSENKLKKYSYLETETLRRPINLHETTKISQILKNNHRRQQKEASEQFKGLRYQYIRDTHDNQKLTQNASGLRLRSTSGKDIYSIKTILGYPDDKERVRKQRDTSIRSIQRLQLTQHQTQRQVSKLRQRCQNLISAVGSCQTLRNNKYHYLQDLTNVSQVQRNRSREFDRIKSKEKQIVERQRRVREKERQLKLKQTESLRQTERQTREKQRIHLRQKQIELQRQKMERQLERQKQVRRDTERQRERSTFVKQIQVNNKASTFYTETTPTINVLSPPPTIKQFKIVDEMAPTTHCSCHQQHCECLNMTTQLNTSRLNRINNKLQSYIARNMNQQKPLTFQKKNQLFHY